MGLPAEKLEHLEQTLIERIRARDPSAFTRWMAQNERWIRGVVYGVLGNRDRVDDVLQQVWMLIWQRADSLRDVRNWRTWVYSVARHAALDAGRDTTRRKRLISGPVEDDLPDPRSREKDAAAGLTEHHERVLRAIEALPAIYREPVILRHLEGWSYRRIAEVMGMPVDSVETRLVRAMRMLRDQLAEPSIDDHDARERKH